MRFRRGEMTLRRMRAGLARRIADLPDLLSWSAPAGRAARNRSRLGAYRDRHAGRRCFIVGNGPSLAAMDLSPLAREITFGANRIYLLREICGFEPTYLICSNELVLEQYHKEIAALAMPKLLNWNGRRHFAGERPDLLFFRLRLELADRFRGNTADLALSSGGTVTYVSMQLAFYMGIREVILIGVDHNFADRGTPNVPEVRTQARDENHFHPDYFPRGSRWQPPDLVRSEIAYSLARDAFARAGGRILDATVGGHCPVFERVEYGRLFARAR